MKIYAGSKINAFAALVAPVFVLGPIIFAVSLLFARFDGAILLLVLGCFACSAVWLLYIKQVSAQLYSWGVFRREEILIKNLFEEDNVISYSKCNGCGIGFYTHGILNSNVGTKVYFIFFSYDSFDETYRSNINLWKPSRTRIKVGFSPKLYNYLIDILPPKQAHMLQKDYKKVCRD